MLLIDTMSVSDGRFCLSKNVGGILLLANVLSNIKILKKHSVNNFLNLVFTFEVSGKQKFMKKSLRGIRRRGTLDILKQTRSSRFNFTWPKDHFSLIEIAAIY